MRRDGVERAAATRNRTRAVVRVFFAWAHATGRIGRNPASAVSPAVYCEPAVCYMTRPELRRFLAVIRRSRCRLAQRDHAMFATLVYTGVRLSELLGIRWGDLDGRTGRLFLRTVKGGGSATRHVSRQVLTILTKLRRAAAGPPTTDAPLFTAGGVPLGARAVQYRFAVWRSRAGIRRRMSVHTLRHTFATLLYRRTADLPLVGRALGHRDVRTTYRYAHVDDRCLAAAIERL